MTRRIWTTAAALLALVSASCGEGPTEPSKMLSPDAPALAQNQVTGVSLQFAGGNTITAGGTFKNVTVVVNGPNTSASPTGSVTLYVLISGGGAIPVATSNFTSHSGNTATAVFDVPFFQNSQAAPYMMFTRSYQAQYNGDATFYQGASPVVNATVNQAVPTAALSYTSPVQAWTSIAINATVTSAVIPQANPQLFDNGVLVGTMSGAGVSGNQAFYGIILNASAMAPSHFHNLQVVVASDNYQTGTQASTSLIATRATPTLSTTTPAAITVGQSMTFTTTATGPANATIPPTGNVLLRVSGSGQVVASGQLQQTNARTSTVTFIVQGNSQLLGTHQFVPDFQQDANYAATQGAAVTGVVNPSTSTLTLSGPSSVAFGATNTVLTAKLTTTVGPSQGVFFTLIDGAQSLGTVSYTTTILPGAIQFNITLQPTLLSVGTHNLKLFYPGEFAISAATSNTIVLNVTPASTSPALTFTNVGGSNINTSGSFTFTTTVPGILGSPPTGTVDVWMGGVNTGTKVLSALPFSFISGVMTATGTLAGNAFPAMSPSNTYTAVYSGDTRYAVANSSVLTGNVTQTTTSTTLSAPASVQLFAGGAMLVATLTSPIAPTGTMTFKDGNTVLGTISTPSSSGAGVYQYIYTTTSQQLTPAGVHTVTASYANDVSAAPSSSQPQSITVNALNSTASIAFNGPGTIFSTGAFNFNFTVNGAGSGIPAPTGSVSLWMGGVGTGTKVAGPIVLAPSGSNAVATASLNGSAFAQMSPSNTYAIAYSGDANYNSASSNSITGVVNPAADVTPPLVTPIVTGTLGQNGWYTSNVSIRWNIVDLESSITAQSECHSDTPVDMVNTFTCSATSQGGTTVGQFALKRDATPPVITVTNLRPVYGVDERIAPACSAKDAMSGLASLTGCVDDNGYRILVGTNTFTLTATDKAGNVGTRSFTFDVVLTKQNLCTLTARWVSAAEGSSLCAMLNGDQFAQYRSAVVTSIATAPHIVILQELADALINH